MPDFKDWGEYQPWLFEQPHDRLVAMAARSALRVVPFLFKSDGTTDARLAIAALRATLTSGVAAVGLTPEVIQAAARSAARSAADADANLSAYSAARSAHLAARSAASAHSVANTTALDAAFSAHTVTPSAALAAALSALSADSEHAGAPSTLFSTRLWPTEPFGTFDATAIHRAAKTDPVWTFWAEWYDGFLNGTPLDWELQRQIALIKDKDWEAGPERVAKRIKDIKRRLDEDKLEAARPQAAALKARPAVMAKIATGLSAQIQAALTAYGQIENAPPEELEPLERFGGLCEGIATHLLADAPEDEIAKLVVAMSDTIRELNRRLSLTRAKGLSTSDTKSARALVREGFFQNVGGMAAGAIFSTALWGYVLSGAQDVVGPTISETIESLSGCHDDLMGPDAIYPPEMWAIPDYSQA